MPHGARADSNIGHLVQAHGSVVQDDWLFGNERGVTPEIASTWC